MQVFWSCLIKHFHQGAAKSDGVIIIQYWFDKDIFCVLIIYHSVKSELNEGWSVCRSQREEITEDDIRRLSDRFTSAHNAAAEGRLHLEQVRQPFNPQTFLMFRCWRDSELTVVSRLHSQNIHWLNADDVFRGKYLLFSSSWPPWCCRRRRTSCFCSAERRRWTTAWSSWGWGSKVNTPCWRRTANTNLVYCKIKLENWKSGASIRPKLLFIQTKYPLDLIVLSFEDLCPVSPALCLPSSPSGWTWDVSGEQKSRQIITVYTDCVCQSFSCVSLV